jgi:NitT/TauT family transport system ATP-binding protein
MQDPVCEVRHVAQQFTRSRGPALRVLEDINLAIHPHEVVALLGPPGCGKSTLLRILAGLAAPVTGEVRFHDQPLHGKNPRANFVFQAFALFPWLTVLDNLESALRPLGLPAREIRRRARHVIELVGLVGFEAAYPHELASVVKQRAGIARALVTDPEILLMDEALGHLDAFTAEHLRGLVLEIWRRAREYPLSIVMVSHDTREVVAMADRIVVLGASPGRIRTIVDNPLPRPRDARSPAFADLVDHIDRIIIASEHQSRA